MIQATLSFNMSANEISIEHNNRTIPVPHSDVIRQCDNFYWSGNKSLQQAYDDLFSDDVKEYNIRQKRKDRRITNYLEKIINSFEREKDELRKLRGQGATLKTLQQHKKAVKPCYEFVVAIGNMHDNPEFSAEDGKRKFEAKEIMQNYVEGFAKRYNGKKFGIEMFNAAIHLCENGQVHLHCDIIFHSNDNKRGMAHQVSMNRALYQLGFCGDEHKLAITKWEEYEREILTAICAEHDIEVIAGKGSKKHLHKEQFILEQEKQRNAERKKALDEQEDKICEFLGSTKNGNAFLLLQENDVLRKKLNDLQEQNTSERTRLSQIWDDYKTANKDYWKRYAVHKEQLKKEIALAISQKKYDKKRFNDLFRSIFEDNGFIITRLFRLISALFLKFRIDREEQQLRELQELNRCFKEQAREICNTSRITAEVLKSKDFIYIDETLKKWEMALFTANHNIENMLGSQEAIKQNTLDR